MSPFSFVNPANTVPFHCLIPWSDLCVCAQSSSMVCDPVDRSPPGFSVQAVFQARILKWVAISFSRGSFQPKDQTCVFDISCIGRQIFFTTVPPGKHYGPIYQCVKHWICVCVCVCSKIDPGFLFSWQKEGGLIF